MRQDNPKAFIYCFIGVVFLTAAVLIGVNVVVDPFYRFDLISIRGFNRQKPQFPTYARMAKPGVVCRLNPASAVLGTSRVEVGIDPAHPALKSRFGPSYNVALAGSGLKELLATFKHVVHASSHLKQVLIGIDFLMFNANREAVVFGTEVFGYDQKRLMLSSSDTCLRSFLYDADNFIGLAGLRHVRNTVINQLSEEDRKDANKVANWISLYDRNGFRNQFDTIKTLVAKRGYRGIFGEGQEYGYASKIWRPPPAGRYCFESPGQANTIETFRDMVRFARQSGAEVIFFINPLHARMMIALQEAGLWPQFEDWKRELVGAVEDEARESGKAPFALWDFSGFNTVTTERIPAAGDLTTEMHWWWEPSHYKKEAGDLILDRIFGFYSASRALPSDFGVKLSADNVEQRIADTRRGTIAYAKAEPGETEIVKKTVNKVMATAEGANCGYYLQPLRAAGEAVRRGDTDGADRAFAQARAIHDAEQKRYAEIGVPYREAGFDDALRAAQAGQDLDRAPRLASWEAYQDRGRQRVKEGDYRGADEDFTQAIRMGPPNTALFFLRGTTRLEIPDYAGAIEDFEAGIKLDPNNKTLRMLLDQARTKLARQKASSRPAETNHSDIAERRVNPAALSAPAAINRSAGR